MTRAFIIRQSDLETALRAALAVGLPISAYKIDKKNGCISIYTSAKEHEAHLEEVLDRELAAFEVNRG